MLLGCSYLSTCQKSSPVSSLNALGVVDSVLPVQSDAYMIDSWVFLSFPFPFPFLFRWWKEGVTLFLLLLEEVHPVCRMVTPLAARAFIMKYYKIILII